MAISVVTFGEVMGRIGPAGHSRLAQVLPGVVEFRYGGGEVNVAASLAMLGAEAAFVTALPRNPMADACLAQLRGIGVDVSGVVRSPGRLGLYFVETGANQRGSSVIYDRDGSSIMLAPPALFDWERLLVGRTWFHVTGITPALSENAALSAIAAVQAAARAGLTVSCDLNFRKKLWNWRPGTPQRDLAREVMTELLQSVHVVIGNEEDADDVLGIRSAGSDVESGVLNVEGYVDVARQVCERFAGVRHVALTLRESQSADHNNWGGMLYTRATDYAEFAPCDANGAYRPYEIRDIVDRVGGGDSFAAGIILGLGEGADPGQAAAFAVAASCLKHSIPGDYNFTTRAEVETLMRGQGTGRVVR